MSEIFVEGLGNINIQGETPTVEEQQAIIDQLKKKQEPTESKNTEQKKTKSFVESTMDAFKTRDTALMAGGMGGFASGARLGAMAGSPFGIPGAVVGGLAGGTLGATGFGQVYDILDSYIKGDNRTVDDATKQAFADAKRETMFGMVGATIPGIKPAITRLLTKKEKGELVGKDVKELYEAGKRIGVDILPIDVAGRTGKMYGKVVGVFPVVGSPIKKAGGLRGRQLNIIKEQVLNDLAPNTHLSDLGVDMFNAAKNSSKEFKNVASDLYNVFYKEAGKINKPFIPTQNIKLEAQKIVDDFLKKRPLTVVTKKGLKGKSKKIKQPISANVNQKYQSYINKLANLDDFITPNQVKQIKQDLGNFSDVVTGKDGAGVFKLTKMSKATDGALRDFDNYNLAGFANDPKVTKESLGKLINDLKAADAFYANGIQIYNRSTAGRFRKVDKNIFMSGFDKPGSIEADELFKYVVKTGSPQSLKDLRTLIGGDNFAKVSRKIIDNAFTKSAVRDDKFRGLLFNPNILEEELGLVGKNSSEVLNNITKGTNLNPQKLKDLIEVSKYHSNLEIPDVGSFVARRVTLGGAKSILGGVAMGAGVFSSPVASIPAIYLTNRASAFLANPKNLDLAIEAFDITAPRSLRYVAGEKLLRGLVKDSSGEEQEAYEDLQKMYKDNKDYIIDNMREL
mgnify:FL=1|tara:strand:+ start:1082 stop:3121 length:2040 start_codon:yes stop_codon:yes gene_type:complete